MEITTKAIGEELKERLRGRVRVLGQKPVLRIITAKDYYPPSKIYIRNKIRVAEEIGITVELIEMEWQGRTKEELIKEIKNTIFSCVTPVIVQVPFPLVSEMEIGEILNSVYKLDVDGFSPIQKGKLVNGDIDTLVPATALGVMTLLKTLKADLTGLSIGIISRSQLIGKPLIQLALLNNMTVNVCHSKSSKEDLKKCLKSDIVVTGCGKRKMFSSVDVNPSAIAIIDCSMDKVEGIDGVGDFDKEDILENTSIAIASGYGHTGLMTVISLMENVVKVYELGGI